MTTANGRSIPLEAAIAYIQAGLCVVPIKTDGSKAPPIKWRQFEKRLPTPEEIERWFHTPDPPGLAIVGGAISGNLECLDFDHRAAEVFPAWCGLVERERPGLTARLSVSRTPKPGFHARYRCADPVPGNTKLAEEGKDECLIETRGEGGYALAPGCPCACHETGRTYEHVSGPPLTQLATLTADERDVLIRCARSFDRKGRAQTAADDFSGLDRFNAGYRPERSSGYPAGDAFNLRGPDWAALLIPHGWALVKTEADGVRKWRRPGKAAGHSATTGGCSNTNGVDLFAVFSNNAAPFRGAHDGKPCSCYTKFAVYTTLNHGGNFAAAAQALAAKGFEQEGGKPAARGNPEAWETPIPLNTPPAVLPFPLDVLPDGLRNYVQKVAWATSAPADFAAVPLLVCAAGAVGNSRRLLITRTHQQPACLFAAVIGRPGSGKSTPLDIIKEPLEKAEQRFLFTYRAKKKAWDSDKPELRGERPALRRLLLDDTTVEAMVKVLGENPRGLMMARDELAALVTGMNQYKDGGKGSDRQAWLKVWSGATIKVDRKSQEDVPLTVRRPLVCIAGGIQPQVIEWLRGEQQGDRPPPDDGFLDRFLLSYPDPLPATGETWRDVADDEAAVWTACVNRLLDLELLERDGERFPDLMPLDDAGRLAWTRLTHEHAAEVNADDFPEWLRGPWAKLVPGYAGRFALVLQLLWDDSRAVTGASVERAFQLVNYFKNHARKVYTVMGADPRAEEARQVLVWLSRHPEIGAFSRRDAHRHLSKTFTRAEALDGPLSRLVDHGFLRVAETPERKGPGRRATMQYQVNPLWRRRIDRIDEMAD